MNPLPWQHSCRGDSCLQEKVAISGNACFGSLYMTGTIRETVKNSL